MDRHTRWTLKFTKTKRQDDGTIPTTDLAIPFFGYKSYVSIDRKFRFIRKCKTTDTAASVGARLREGLLDQTNTALTVWADRAVRPDCRCHPGRHDDRTGQYHLQHAPLPLPGADQHHSVAIKRVTAPNLLKTQIKSDLKNRQSIRQIPEITGQAYQPRVLRSLQLAEPFSISSLSKKSIHRRMS